MNELKTANEKQKTKLDVLSEKIIELQQKDIDEYQNEVKKKSYFLSRFIKTEMIIRSAQLGCSKATFKLNAKATRALMGLGFIVEDGTLSFTAKALDRNTFLISFKLYSDKLSNAQIYYYNATYDLNIPLNDEIEIIPDDEQIDDGFIKQNVLRIKRG